MERNTKRSKKNEEGQAAAESRWKIQKFLQSRRNTETRSYVATIIQFLDKTRKDDIERGTPEPEAGWVRVKTILDTFVGEDSPIKNETTLYRLLDALAEARILDRMLRKMPNERGRRATFYKTATTFPEQWVFTREQLEEKYWEQRESIQDLVGQLLIAQDILIERGCENPHEQISEQFRRKRERDPIYTAYRDPSFKTGQMSVTQYPVPELKRVRNVLKFGPKNKNSFF